MGIHCLVRGLFHFEVDLSEKSVLLPGHIHIYPVLFKSLLFRIYFLHQFVNLLRFHGNWSELSRHLGDAC